MRIFLDDRVYFTQKQFLCGHMPARIEALSPQTSIWHSAIGIWPLERIGSSLPVSFLSIEGLNAKCQWPGAVLLAEC
jgi:hypothetical protein